MEANFNGGSFTGSAVFAGVVTFDGDGTVVFGVEEFGCVACGAERATLFINAGVPINAEAMTSDAVLFPRERCMREDFFMGILPPDKVEQVMRYRQRARFFREAIIEPRQFAAPQWQA